jgi:hypothetical protein
VVPPRAEIITAPAPGPVAGAAPAPFIPPPVPPPATPPFSASGSPSNNYAIGPPGGMPASPPLWGSQQMLAHAGRFTAAMRRSSRGIIVFAVAAVVVAAVAILAIAVVDVVRNYQSNATSDNHESVSNPFGSADEAAALSNPPFANPIVLHIDPDDFSQAQRLKSLNGVSDSEFGVLTAFSPCVNLEDGSGNHSGINAYIAGYNFDPGILATWLSNNRIIQYENYHIRYPREEAQNATGLYGSDGFRTATTYGCTVVNDSVGKYLSSSPGENVHNGLDIPVGRRILTKWTFSNRYETPVPGRGNVKVFAGTFSYRIDPLVPIVSFSGEGTATVKMFLNPDDGQWTIDKWEEHDPSITILTNPL